MNTFSGQALIANPEWPPRRLSVELLVGTGGTHTLLTGEVVKFVDEAR